MLNHLNEKDAQLIRIIDDSINQSHVDLSKHMLSEETGKLEIAK
jgi:hypothetical protein